MVTNDKKVYYTLVQDDASKALERMHELYAEGLIALEIFCQDGSSCSTKAASGRVGRNSGGKRRGDLDGVERIILDDKS